MRFSIHDVLRFAAWSADRNPLHVDPEFARHTHFGRQVVHGVLTAFASLEAAQLPPGRRLTGLDIEFRNAAVIGGSYQAAARVEGDTLLVSLREGDQLVLEIRGELAPALEASSSQADPWLAAARERAPRTSAAVHELADLQRGVESVGRYALRGPEPYEAAPVLGETQARVLALCSYITGMEMPGLKSLFTRISLTFHAESDGADELLYRAHTTRFDANFRLLDTRVQVARPDGTIVATGLLRSYVPFSPVQSDLAQLAARLDSPTTRLSGVVALVVGASRGLGADIAASLALAGAHVYASARQDDAQRVDQHQRLADAGHPVEFLEGDAGNVEWCQDAVARIRSRHGRLDLLVLNACAAPPTLRAGSAPDRYADYVRDNLRLISVPLSAAVDSIAESRGAIAFISSSAVDRPPAGWSHYVALKQAGEALTRAAALENGVYTLIARPPGLQTAWNDSPSRAVGTIPSDWAASHLVNRLAQPWASGACDVLSEFPAFAPAAPAHEAELSVRLAASFTTDALAPLLRFWVKELDLDAAVDVAPYGQVLQSLLDPGSALNARRRGVNALLLRVRDWLHELNDEQLVDMAFLQPYLQKTARDFEAAVRTHRAQASVETLLVLCPSFGALSSAESILLRQAESEITAALQGLPGLQIVAAADYHARYGVNEDEVHDALRDDIAHIPYSDEYLATLATIVARLASRRFSGVRKVVVVDCDNTLWRGVVGEAGAEGLEFDASHRALHQTLDRLTQGGVLVCLCSKNEEPDVWRVFETRPELGLRRDRVVAATINWLPKSQNLRTLAGRLNLGLDSFVFVDDNPVECAEVRANCPEVLTIEWPHDSERALRLLEHIWEFDPGKSTKEDARRTELYKEEFRRQEARAETLTFDDFIKSLGLEVDFAPLAPEDVRRSAQLTLRTNQFNFTTVRREEADLQALVAEGRHEIRTIRVRDRFGDYGLVGLVIAERDAAAWALDTFLLSCRVLGRGVEHQILADLGTMARAAGAESVTLRLETTKRNTPARSFLEAVIPEQWREGDDRGVKCQVPAAELASVRFEPTVTGEVVVQEEGGSKPGAPLDVSRLRRREEQIVRAAFALASGRDVLSRSRGTAEPEHGGLGSLATGKPEGEAAAKGDVVRIVHAAFAAALRVSPEQVASVDRLESLGCDSLRIVEITVALSETYPWLPSTLLFEHRAVSQIVDEIVRLAQSRVSPAAAPVPEPRGAARATTKSADIAVVGMHVRCAGANSLGEFWSLLSTGASAVKPVPTDRQHFLHPLQDSRPHWAGLLDDVAGFDPEFFGVSPREAAVMDPQLRLFLEVAWGALEDAGAAGVQHDPQTGVFAGVMYGDYGFRANLGEGAGLYRCWEGFSLANRLSQLLGFRGPSLAVDTACSSSGTALHLACQALKAGDCRVALVGGVNLILDPDRFGSLGRLGILSSRGQCEPFGADADGTVLGEGAGVVVLRPLDDALSRGDRIYGVIKGTGISTGSGTVGFTAPNPQAQAEAISRSVRAAGIDPRSISYVETHGTGTSLGDPIEVRGLSLGYGVADLDGASHESRCAIGSIKPNIGHLEAGAAVMGLIKVLLQLQHKQLVPSITSAAPNPQIPFDRLPFRVQRALETWDAPVVTGNGVATLVPRRAGLNSFGVGGANAHVIIEEAPATAPARPAVDRPVHELALSAPSPDALAAQAAALAAHLAQAPELSIGDVCYSVNTGRRHFEYRRAVTAADIAELRRGLGSVTAGSTGARAGAAAARPKVAFLFTGQGSQYAGMGRQLYATQPVFRAALDRCAEVFDRLLGRRLLDLLFAEAGSADGELLNQTGFTQPALFAFEYALAQLWRSWGVQPDVVMGHSVGEIAAMCVAGGVSLEDGLKLIAARGRLMQELPAGGVMTSVMADEARVLEAIAPSRDTVAIAAVNAPGQVVISGAGAAVAEIAARLTADGIKTKPLTVSHAFHSPLMKPMLARYAEVVREIRFSAPEIPFVSCVDGRFVTTELTSPDYWLRQVMDPVRFAAGTRVLEDAGVSAFIEIGPHPVLLGMARRCVKDDAESAWLPSLRRDGDESRTILSSVGALYEHGADVDWERFDAPYARTRIQVPAYAFSHRPYWLKLGQLVETAAPAAATEPQRYEIAWRDAAPEAPGTNALQGPWLVFADRRRVGAALVALLERAGASIEVVAADRIDPANPAEYERVVREATVQGQTPRVVHLWNLDAPAAAALDEPALNAATDRGVTSVVLLAQAMAKAGARSRLWVVTERAVATSGDDGALALAQSPAWGLGRTIALEYPELWGGLIDVAFAGPEDAAAAIGRELAAGSADDQVALRPDVRRVPRLVAGVWRGRAAPPLSSDGTYLVTGGTGAIGLRMGRWLVDNGARHVVLASRRGETDERTRAAVEALQQRGAAVCVAACDVSSPGAVDALLASMASGGHPLQGLVHAAGIDATVPLAQLSADEIRRVLASKVTGGWVLHDRTKALGLDLFVLCSSMASVLGAQGRAHYAAANAFLDTLAHERRRQGLEATAINWGPWKGGGMAGAAQLEQFERIGNRGLDPERALGALAEIAQDGVAQVAVADIDWSRFRSAYEARRPRPLVSEIAADAVPVSSAVATGGTAAPWVAQLLAVETDRRESMLATLLQSEVADTMGFDQPAKVLPDRDFFDLGMDSLMMAELVSRLKKQVGTAVSDLVFDAPTVRALASKLLERLALAGAASAPAAPTGLSAADDAPRDDMSGYRDQDALAIDAFQAAAWPRRRRDLIPPRWRWLLLESARRLGVAPMVWLYRAEGRLLGHMGAVPVRLKVGSEEHQTAWLVDTMVLEEHRQKGIGPRLMLQAHDDLPFALSLGQTAEMREIQARLGWHNVAPVQVAQLLIRPEAVLEGKLPKPAAKAAAWGLRATSAVRNMVSGVAKGRPRLCAREIDSFGPAHDQLWAEMSPSMPCGVVRDASYLNWKYVAQPGQNFLRLEILDGDALRGVAVVMFREPDQRYRYRRAFLVDVVAPLSDHTRMVQVVQAAVDAAAARGADAMSSLHIGRPLTQALAACGFVLRQPERFLLVDSTPLSGRALDQVLDADAWYITHGDSDIDRPW